MTNSSKLLSQRREELLEKEEAILNELEDGANELTNRIDKTAKNIVLIAVGLLAGYAVYKTLSDEEPVKKKKPAGKQTKSRLTPLLTMAAQKGLAVLVDSIKSDLKK